MIDEQRTSLPSTKMLGRLSARGIDELERQSSGTDNLSTYQPVAAKSGLLVVGSSTVARHLAAQAPRSSRLDSSSLVARWATTLLRAYCATARGDLAKHPVFPRNRRHRRKVPSADLRTCSNMNRTTPTQLSCRRGQAASNICRIDPPACAVGFHPLALIETYLRVREPRAATRSGRDSAAHARLQDIPRRIGSSDAAGCRTGCKATPRHPGSIYTFGTHS